MFFQYEDDGDGVTKFSVLDVYQMVISDNSITVCKLTFPLGIFRKQFKT